MTRRIAFGRRGRLLALASGMTACVVVLSLVLGLSARAEKIDQTDPDLQFKVIDSNLEELYGETGYTCTGTFQQDKGAYMVKTNAYCVWRTVDDISYAYNRYEVGNKGDDYLEISTRVESMAPEKEGDSLHMNASAGLMLRSSLDPAGAEVFLHVRSREVMVVYRSKDGANTGAQYTGIAPAFPIDLKMVKKGNQVTCSFKTAEMDQWNTMRPVGLQAPGPLYAGLASHSVDRNVQMIARYQGFRAVGVGTYDGTGGGDDDSGSSTPDEEPEFVQPDPPLTDPSILLRETFTDGSLVNTPASVTNPVWNNPQDVEILTLENGNRVWNKNFVFSQDYVGNQNWTDYRASMEVQFSKNCDPDPLNASNRVKLYARHTDNEFYGNSDYAAVLEYGNIVALYKRTHVGDSLDENGTCLQKVSVAPYLGDGKTHTLAIEAFDNVLRVYWDGEELIHYVDDGSNVEFASLVHTKGGIGVYTNETSVSIDNIVVKKLDDPLGGDYDNTIGGNWDQPIPDYLTEWTDSGRPY